MSSRLRLGVQQALFGWVNFALTAPAIYLWLGLPLVMRQQGWSGTEIGLFQLAGLPAVFKALLAIPVERWPAPVPSNSPSGLPSARSSGIHAWLRWAWLTGGGFALCLLALAVAGDQAGKATLFALALLAALLSTWADIPVQALAIGLLPPQARPLAGGIRAAATFAGAVVGGGVMLLLQQARGWALPFLILAAGVLSALIVVAVLGRRSGVQMSTVSKAPAPALWPTWQGFFRQPGAPAWALLLVGQFPFVAAAWVFLKPLLLDHGLQPGQVAVVAGVGGGALGACASIAAGLLRRERLKSAALWSSWANALALALLAVALASGAGVAGLQKHEDLTIGGHNTLPMLWKNFKNFETPATPNVIGIYLLGKIAEDLNNIGVDTVRKQTEEKYKLLNKFVETSQNFTPSVVEERHRSRTVIVANTKLPSGEVIAEIKKSNMIVGSGYGPYKDTQIRIANFPAVSLEQVETLIQVLKKIDD